MNIFRSRLLFILYIVLILLGLAVPFTFIKKGAGQLITPVTRENPVKKRVLDRYNFNYLKLAHIKETNFVLDDNLNDIDDISATRRKIVEQAAACYVGGEYGLTTK